MGVFIGDDGVPAQLNMGLIGVLAVLWVLRYGAML